MNIVDQPHKPDKVLDLHQRAVENLESILSEDDAESEGSDCSMSESDEYDEDLEMEDEVDDSTTLSMYQEGLRKENLVRKGSVLSTMSQKKGRLGEDLISLVGIVGVPLAKKKFSEFVGFSKKIILTCLLW
ncbi:uncharacterized protein LOC120257928 [Dioscorea cayenensis subsp. rotundata]|uniref:Uncharacterized protein LOC120257928 n=1 Tax=Dioscorea cayennensis subsp. rotundata TaxID=55577 RepID=A0AB40B249_DIOCR|nr:uncharacterized protein LOC120257928 [Dioscorea cayenensis subsp. rotundata]